VINSSPPLSDRFARLGPIALVLLLSVVALAGDRPEDASQESDPASSDTIDWQFYDFLPDATYDLNLPLQWNAGNSPIGSRILDGRTSGGHTLSSRSARSVSVPRNRQGKNRQSVFSQRPASSIRQASFEDVLRAPDFEQPTGVPQGSAASSLTSELPQSGLTAPDSFPGLESEDSLEFVNPPVLAPPSLDSEADGMDLPAMPEPFVDWEDESPLGFSGASGIIPRDSQDSAHFLPIEDRWRLGFPEWDRDGKGDPANEDAPYDLGRGWNPYNLNVLKGDYPIIGQHTFLNLTATQTSIFEARALPTATTPFESTIDSGERDFFGKPNQFFTTNFTKLQFDLFHGNAAFKPVDWQIRLAPVFNVNYLQAQELSVVNPDPRKGTTRLRDEFALEEYFVEAKLADLSPDYDFVSARLGSQLFTSDFRGFIFSDTNRMLRIFGNEHANRDQYNVVVVKQTEKDTNSQLNTFDSRHQTTVIANFFRQDFIYPGYTASASYHFNHDQATQRFDRNDFLARPDPVGVFRPHELNAHYFGFAGDGHIERFNISHAYYHVFGRDERNPLAGRQVDISAHMAAVELSYDRDYVRFRTSYFYSSGDNNPTDKQAGGFDSIFDRPNFAGGAFSYWQRQQVPLFGTSLTNRESLIPDLRSSKFQGQSNFVNPGLQLANLGFDVDITPKTKLIHNTNFLWFDTTKPLETFLFQSPIHRRIGTDVSFGVEYRPLLNNNVIFTLGAAGLFPGSGFRDIYETLNGKVKPPYSTFLEMQLTF